MSVKKVRVSELPQLQPDASGEGIFMPAADSNNKTYRVPVSRYYYKLPFATKSVLGGVKIGDTLNVDSSGVVDIKSDVELPGNPTTTTPNQADKSNRISTTKFVQDNFARLDNVGYKDSQILRVAHFPSHSELVALGYNTADKEIDNEAYIKGICKWAEDTLVTSVPIVLIGMANPNSIAFVQLVLYRKYTPASQTGLPRYCLGSYFSLNGSMYTFGTLEYEWYYRRVRFIDTMMNAFSMDAEQIIDLSTTDGVEKQKETGEEAADTVGNVVVDE